MRNSRLIFMAIAMASISNVHANTQVSLFGDRTIVSVGAYVSGGYIQFTPALSNAEGCTTQNHLWIDWSTQPDGKALYATVIAAYLAGQKLSFGVSGCSGTGSPLVYRVDIVS